MRQNASEVLPKTPGFSSQVSKRNARNSKSEPENAGKPRFRGSFQYPPVSAVSASPDTAASKQPACPGMLERLPGAGAEARREGYVSTRTRMARFPFQRTLEQFGFAFQPSIGEWQLRELAGLAFVAEAADIPLPGPPGVGQTHLALAQGAIERGCGACFVRACDRDAATACCTLVSARYERGSIILTPNKDFGEWGELLGDTVIAPAVLDRLRRHSPVLNIRGGSCRLRQKGQPGIFSSSSAILKTSRGQLRWRSGCELPRSCSPCSRTGTATIPSPWRPRCASCGPSSTLDRASHGRPSIGPS